MCWLHSKAERLSKHMKFPHLTYVCTQQENLADKIIICFELMQTFGLCNVLALIELVLLVLQWVELLSKTKTMQHINPNLCM